MDTSKETPETDPVRLAADCHHASCDGWLYAERLEAALREIVDRHQNQWRYRSPNIAGDMAAIARAALAPAADDSQGGGSV